MYADMSDALYRGGGGGKEEADGSNKNRQRGKVLFLEKVAAFCGMEKAESLSSLLPQYVFSAIISLSLSSQTFGLLNGGLPSFFSSFYVTPFLFSLPPFSPLMVMVSLPSSCFLPPFSIVSPSSFLSHPAPKKDFECPSPFLIDIARRKKDEEKRERWRDGISRFASSSISPAILL